MTPNPHPVPSAGAATLRQEGCGRRRRAAFTLLEVLLAVAVFAIVLGAINSVFFAALRLRNKTAQALDRSLPVQHALSVLRRDLDGIVPPGSVFSGQLQTTPTHTTSAVESIGQRVTPDLYTTTGAIDEWSPFAEVQRVAYFLAAPTNQTAGLELYRAVARNLLPAGSEADAERQFLLGGIRNFALQFYDGLDWAEYWDSSLSTNLPLAFRVQIALAESEQTGGRSGTELPPIEMVVPILVQARGNPSGQSAGGGP